MFPSSLFLPLSYIFFLLDLSCVLVPLTDSRGSIRLKRGVWPVDIVELHPRTLFISFSAEAECQESIFSHVAFRLSLSLVLNTNLLAVLLCYALLLLLSSNFNVCIAALQGSTDDRSRVVLKKKGVVPFLKFRYFLKAIRLHQLAVVSRIEIVQLCV